MQLEYRILWFEDQPEPIRPTVENIEQGLVALGFIPKIEVRYAAADGPDPLQDLPPQRDVDLVLMDFMLGGSGSYDGATLSKRVRQIFKYTDIVFYSSAAQSILRKRIAAEDIDGVYLSGRTALSENTLGIIETQMQKVLDLNHMRGIVMATVSDLDHAMIDCLDTIHRLAYPGDADAFAGIIAAMVTAKMRSKADDFEKLGKKKGKLQKLLKDPNFNAELRLETLRVELGKLADKMLEPKLLEKLGSYLSEVITPRNHFAHKRAEVKDGQLHLEGHPEPFSQEGMTQLRLELMAHGDNLHTLLGVLRKMTQGAGNGVGQIAQAVTPTQTAPIQSVPITMPLEDTADAETPSPDGSTTK